MTTSHADHAKALRLILQVVTPDQANEILFRFNSAGIHLVSIVPPVEPYTGDKAPGEVAKAALAEMRAVVRGITPTEENTDD
ncbi:MAG TPA: hypothetical protein VIP58_00880 [Nocardioides sp.]